MMFESVAKAQQETVDDAYRLLGTRNHGVGCFPTFLLLCLERRVWESEREDASGKPVSPCSFHDFIHAPYPDGLASSYAAIEPIIASEPKLVTLWQEVSGRTIDKAPVALSVTSIRTDGGTQSRAAIDEGVVTDYQDHIDKLPPVVVFYDGADYWLADGFHRLEAHKRTGRESITAEVRQGTRRDAVLFSVGANASHGLRRTNADKRRAVDLLLRDAEWRLKSDRWVASRCGVSHDFVNRHRKQLSSDDSCDELDRSCPSAAAPRIGQDGKTRKLPERTLPARPLPPPQEPTQQQAPEFAVPASVAPEPPAEPLSRMRQMTIDDRLEGAAEPSRTQPSPAPALAQVHHLEGLLFSAAERAVQRLSDSEWRALVDRETERRATLASEVDR
jgi:uncharacterized ParB-like nuclease family protein